MRSVRPYSEAVAFQDVVRIIANRNLFFGRDQSLACNETVTSVTPTLIPNTGATITFTGFGIACAGVQSIEVGSAACTSVNVISDTSVSCVAPAVPAAQSDVVATVTFNTGYQVQLLVSYYTALSVKSAQIAANGDSILVQFNVPNNKGGSGNCAFILDSASLSLLGTSPTCSYRHGSCSDVDCASDSNNSELLVIQFGAGATLVAGDSLVIRPNVIAHFAVSTNFVSGAVVVANPPAGDILVPSFSIGVPSSVGSCSDITAQISGLTGQASRDWSSVSYTITPTTTSLTTLLSGFAASRTTYFTIPTALLTAGTSYSIQATFTNWFQKSTTNSASVSVASTPSPDVVLGTPVVTVTRDQPIVLSVSVSKPSCLATATVTYAWTSSDLNVDLGTASSATLYFAPDTLSPGTYTVNYCASVAGSGSVCVHPQIIVNYRDFVVSVGWSGSLQYGADQSIILPGSVSDPDNGPGVFTYSWSASGGFRGSILNSTKLSAVGSSSGNGFSVGDVYTFTLTASKPGRTPVSASGTVTIVTGAPVVLAINAYYVFGDTDVPAISGTIFNPDYRVRIVATVLSGHNPKQLTWAWTVSGGFDSKATSYYFEDNALAQQSFTLRSGIYIPGNVYTFALAVSGGGSAGSSSASLTANIPPCCGSVQVTSNVLNGGDANNWWDLQYIFTAAGYQSGAGAAITTYAFAETTTSLVPVTDATPNNFYVANGNLGSGVHTFRVIVTDSVGSSTTTYVNVTVPVAVVTSEQLTAITSQVLGSLTNDEGKITNLGQTLSALNGIYS